MTATKAVAKVVYTGQPADAQTLIVGTKTYTYKTTLTPTLGQIKIGATLAATLTNTVEALGGGANQGTDYSALGTAAVVITAISNASPPVASTATTTGLVTNSTCVTITGSSVAANNGTWLTGTVTPGVSFVMLNPDGTTPAAPGVSAGSPVWTVANDQAPLAVAANNTVFLTARAPGGATFVAPQLNGNAIPLSTTATGATVQAFKFGLTAGTFSTVGLSWDRHRSVDIDYEVIQDVRIFPLEVGSVVVPTGDYKAGDFLAGGATIMPRLDGSFGDLLLGAMGSATVANNSPVTGAHTHTFTFDPNYPEDVPWMSVRKMIPGRGNIRPQGITGLDNKMASLRIIIPQNDIVSARVDFMGRITQFDQYADSWLYAQAFEQADRVPFSCKGDFKLPTLFSNNLPVTNVVIELVNNITTPREETIIGAYEPDDYVVRSRVVTVRFVYKWSDPALFQYVYTGLNTNQTAWSPTPFVTKYDNGVNYAFEAQIQSVANITGTTPYTLLIRAGQVIWEAASPVRLVGGGILSMEFRGTCIQPDAGVNANYCDFQLVNGQSTAYALPAAP